MLVISPELQRDLKHLKTMTVYYSSRVCRFTGRSARWAWLVSAGLVYTSVIHWGFAGVWLAQDGLIWDRASFLHLASRPPAG